MRRELYYNGDEHSYIVIVRSLFAQSKGIRDYITISTTSKEGQEHDGVCIDIDQLPRIVEQLTEAIDRAAKPIKEWRRLASLSMNECESVARTVGYEISYLKREDPDWRVKGLYREIIYSGWTQVGEYVSYIAAARASLKEIANTHELPYINDVWVADCEPYFPPPQEDN